MARKEHCLYFLIMYYSEINYKIYIRFIKYVFKVTVKLLDELYYFSMIIFDKNASS